ncbi:MAG: Rrf2 family transcriptional regulator [Candidatus Gracilibacteria bacterium]|jgi:Rrf2 family protein
MNNNLQKNQQSGSMHVTKKVDYGLLLLSELANAGNPLSIDKIAKQNNLSFLFLQRIASDLKKAKIISSTRGKFGGYVLSKKPSEITIKEVIESLDGAISIAPCLSRNKGTCQCNKSCKIKQGLNKINEIIKQSFMQKTLNEII